ncbi:MAG: hypothetical protein ACTHNW_13275 [Mucilaginibacter sp.]
MKKILIVFIIPVFLLSCSKKREIKQALDGWWSIDSIYFEHYNVKNCIESNLILFKFNGRSELPISVNGCNTFINGNNDKFAIIKVLDSESPNDTIPFRLQIDTKNKIFAGTHKIIFYKDNYNHLLKMEIWSDKLYIVCRKGLFDIDTNSQLVNDLEKISWTNRPKQY